MAPQIKVGISGLDAMLYGGIPERNQVLIAGGPGAGKSLLALEYLYRNAKMGNVGIFFALDEDRDALINDAKAAFPEFRDLEELIRKKKIIINTEAAATLYSDSAPEYNFGKMTSEMESEIASSGAKRVVIDTISLLEILITDKVAYRRALLAMIRNMKRLGATSLIITHLENPDRSRLTFRPEFFVFDGIILMYQTGEEMKRLPAIEVIKMRGAKHSYITTPYDISPSGFRVLAAEDITAAYG